MIDNIETVERIKYANFQLSYFAMIVVLLHEKMLIVCVCIPISTPTLSGIAYFFPARKSPLQVRCLYAYVQSLSHLRVQIISLQNRGCMKTKHLQHHLKCQY